MAEEKVTLALEVQTSGVKKGAEELDKLAQSGAKAEKATTGVSDAAARANAQIAAMAQRVKTTGESFKPLDVAANSIAKISTESKSASQGINSLASNSRRDFASIAAEAKKVQESLSAIKATGSQAEISKATASAIVQMAKLRQEFDATRLSPAISEAAAKVNAQLSSMSQKAAIASVSISAINSQSLANVAKEADSAASSMVAISTIAKSASGGQFFSGLGAGAIGAAGGLIAVAAAFAGIAAAKVSAAFSIKDTADELYKLSQRTGLTVESLSELRYAGELSDVSMGEIGNSLKILANKMQEAAKGSGAAYEAFKAMGISVKDSAGQLKSSEEVLGDVADKFSGYKDGAAKAALANDVFGKSGEKLIPLLNQGRDGMRDSAEEARKLGVVYSSELAKKAEELNDNITRLKFGFEGLKIYLASDVLPTLSNIVSQLVEGAKAAGGFGAALLAMGTINPFKSTSSNIKSIQGDLAKMEQDLKDYGYIDDQAYQRKKAQLDYLKTQQVNDAVASSAGAYSNEGRGRSAGDGKTDAPIPVKDDKPKKPRATGGRAIASQASDEAKAYANTMQGLADIARDADASTLDLTASQKKLYDLMSSANWAKMPDAWKQTAIAQFESARAAELNAKFLKDVEAQQQKNLNGRQSMIEQIQKAQDETDKYGLTAAQISVVEQSRLADAVATLEQASAAAKLAGASETEQQNMQAQIAFLREELQLRGKLSDTLSAKEAKQYDIQDAAKSVEEKSGELGEFLKQAAKNSQDAMAEFFINPTKDGMSSIGDSFGKTLKKMIAQAASAQLLKLMLGDVDKTGNIGGLIGKVIGTSSDSSSGSGIGGIFSDLISAFGFHGGGMVGSNDHSFTRTVPVSLFNNAPRYHSGGIVGDEVPAILKKGERVLTKEQQQGMGGSVVININSSNGDPAEIRRAAAAGARTALGAMNGARRYG